MFGKVAPVGPATTKPEPLLLHLSKMPLRKEADNLPASDREFAKATAAVGKHFFIGRLLLGRPTTQVLQVIFDTASGQVILPSSGCLSSPCLQRRRYAPAASAAAEVVNADGSTVAQSRRLGVIGSEGQLRGDTMTVGISSPDLGEGKVSGFLVRDRVCVGAIKGRQACAEMGLVAAHEMADQPFGRMPSDGIVGLGLANLSASPLFNFLGRLSAQGGLPERRFGFFLGESGGELALGGYNAKRLSGPISWMPVARPEQGYWQVRILSARAGNRTLANCTRGGCWGIIDAGASRLGVPSRLAPVVSAALAATFDAEPLLCDNPDLVLELEGAVTLILRPAEYADAACVPQIAPLELPKEFADTFILGEQMLRRYYAVFDWDDAGPRVGLGLAKAMSATEVKEAAATETKEALYAEAVAAPLRGEDVPLTEEDYDYAWRIAFILRALLVIGPEMIILTLAMTYARHFQLLLVRALSALARMGLLAKSMSLVTPLSVDQVPDGGECVICLDSMEDCTSKCCSVAALWSSSGPRWCRLRCTHIFHEECLFKWLARSPHCPVCRTHAMGGALIKGIGGLASSP